MNEWTDEDVVARLHSTFAEHEPDVDADVAQRIARDVRPPRRRWLPAAAAAAVLVLVLAGAVVLFGGDHGEPDPSIAPGTSTPPAGPGPQAGAGDNRAAAKAAAARTIANIPLPPGARERNSAPTRSLRHLGCRCDEVDDSLTRTRWWVVPLSYTDLAAWYVTNTPADDGLAPSLVARAIRERTGSFAWSSGPSDDRYSTPEIVVAYQRLTADTTAVRADVTLAARYDRTADTIAPDTVTSVVITRYLLGAEPQPPDGSATVTDPTTIARIVTAFNRLPGSYAGTSQTLCAISSANTYQYELTFVWAGHTLVNGVGATPCGLGRELTLDGHQLAVTLDGTTAFDDVMRQALAAQGVGTPRR